MKMSEIEIKDSKRVINKVTYKIKPADFSTGLYKLNFELLILVV